MTVTHITEEGNRDTVALLRKLLERAEAGRLVGIACIVKMGPKRHRMGIAGDYWLDPLEVLGGATRLEYRINELITDRQPGAAESRTMPL